VVVRQFISLFWLIIMCQGQVQINYLGEFGGTGTLAGLFKNPAAITISDDKRVFVCDRGNHRIQIFDLKGNYLREIGRFGWKEREFDEPMDICVRSMLNIYIADYNNQRIQRFDRNLNFISVLNSNPGDHERFQYREVLSVLNSSQGDLFVLDGGENKVIKFTAQNAGQTAFGYYESGMGELVKPVQLDISSTNQIIVTDSDGHGVLIYDYFGNFIRKIEHEGMQRPYGLAIDRQDRIYVSDIESRALYIFNLKGRLLGNITEVGGNFLRIPRDIVPYYLDTNRFRLYIIDGDMIKIVEIDFNPSGK
jgi:tripartite motif-containing protein 71